MPLTVHYPRTTSGRGTPRIAATARGCALFPLRRAAWAPCRYGLFCWLLRESIVLVGSEWR